MEYILKTPNEQIKIEAKQINKLNLDSPDLELSFVFEADSKQLPIVKALAKKCETTNFIMSILMNDKEYGIAAINALSDDEYTVSCFCCDVDYNDA